LKANVNSSRQILDISNFRGDEELFPRNTGLFNGNADFFFVAISLCTVDVADSLLDGAFDYLDKIFVEAGVFLSSF
jgi:hypothetical protein